MVPLPAPRSQHPTAAVAAAAPPPPAAQGLTTLLLLLFAVILGVGATEAADALPGGHFFGVGVGDWGAVRPALPIMFLALVYHDLVPLIVSFLGGRRATIR